MKRTRQLPLTPADPVGEQFTEIFNHPWDFIMAAMPEAGSRPEWKSIDKYPIQPRNLWDIYKDPNYLIGLRFGQQTQYALIDIDTNSPYHPANDPQKFRAIPQALEEIGLCRHLVIQSSDRGGVHIYYFLPEAVPTFGLACAIKLALEDQDFESKDGTLEIFPNVKAYSKGKPTNYKAHRLPLQTNSYWLDDDLAPISNNIAQFLEAAEIAAGGQDIEQLLSSIEAATERQKARFNPKGSRKLSDWQQDLETRLAQGWTGAGQTNELLKDFVCYGIVFKGLSAEKLIEYVVNAIKGAPGYTEYCNHQHEIRARVAEWVKCTEKNQFYSPYPSYPNRAGSYREILGADGKEGAKNNAVSFARNAINEQRRIEATERIKQAVEALEARGELPLQVGVRAKAIIAKARELTGITISNGTLHKKNYLSLWHPKHQRGGCVQEPAEGVSAEIALEEIPESPLSAELIKTPEPAWEEDLEKNPTPPPYMKVVFEELSAPETPQGSQGAGEIGETISEANTQPISFAIFSDDKQNLSKKAEEWSAPERVEGEKNVGLGEPTHWGIEGVLRISEMPPELKLKLHLTRLRLEATAMAPKEVRKMEILAGKRFSREEHQLRQALTKMQMLWKSEEPLLREEVSEWVERTARAVMTASGPMLEEEESSAFESQMNVVEAHEGRQTIPGIAHRVNELPPVETSSAAVPEASAPLKLGDKVCHVDPYRQASDWHGTIEEIRRGNEARVKWAELEGKPGPSSIWYWFTELKLIE